MTPNGIVYEINQTWEKSGFWMKIAVDLDENQLINGA